MTPKIDVKLLDEAAIVKWFRETAAAVADAETAAVLADARPRICPLCRLEDCTCEGTD